MPERPVGIADTPAGTGIAQVRTRERTVGAETVAEQYMIPVAERVPSYKGSYSSFRTVGLASANHNIFTIMNKSGSTVLLAVRALTIVFDTTGVDTTLADIVAVSRITATPTGGTVLTPSSYDTALTHNASVEAMGATAADAGAATAITATPVGARLWSVLKMRVGTVVGQILLPQESLLPLFCADDPVLLRAGEGLLVQVVQAALITDYYIVNCAIEEFTFP